MTRKKKTTIFLEILTIVIFILFLSPFVILIMNASKETSFEVLTDPLALTGTLAQLLENMDEVWNSTNTQYQQAFFNSIVITTGSLLSIVVASSMAAWVLVRTKSKISNIIFLLFVVAMIIPFQVVMIPLVSWFRTLRDVTGLPFLRSHFGMIFAYVGFGAPLSIFMYHGFMKSIPYELEEAAEIDGCNKVQTFVYIVFPILKPITITIMLLNGIWIWNDFLLPLLILGKGTPVQTVPLAIVNYVGAFVAEYQFLLAAVLIAMIPVVILFLFAQKFIIKGMVAGSIK
jgi:raffinose/stachyose/melibiose transport system permease protein